MGKLSLARDLECGLTAVKEGAGLEGGCLLPVTPLPRQARLSQMSRTQARV